MLTCLAQQCLNHVLCVWKNVRKTDPSIKQRNKCCIGYWNITISHILKLKTKIVTEKNKRNRRYIIYENIWIFKDGSGTRLLSTLTGGSRVPGSRVTALQWVPNTHRELFTLQANIVKSRLTWLPDVCIYRIHFKSSARPNKCTPQDFSYWEFTYNINRTIPTFFTSLDICWNEIH